MKFFHSDWTVIWKSVVFFLFWGVMLGFLIVPFQAKLTHWEQANGLLARLYFEFSAMMAILLSAYIMCSLIDKRPFRSLGFDLRYIFRDTLLGIAVGISWLGVSIGILLLGGWIKFQHALPISINIFALGSIGLFMNVMTQEILVRSYIFQTLQMHFGVVIALILSSLLFTVFHAGVLKEFPLAGFNVFCAGLLFGVGYAMSKNLWFPIVMHFAWNWILGLILGQSISGQNPFHVNWQLMRIEGPGLFTGGAFGLEGSIIVTGTTVGLIGGVIFYWRYLSSHFCR